MISEGQITLFKFPQTDQQAGKLRPALVLRKIPGRYDDWLICMISSQLHQKILELDEVITTKDSDFIRSGLKLPSVIRASRLAVVEKNILLGKLGQISQNRLSRVRQNLARWISHISG
ncbi:MAG: type II toxin-antitoxin system PemK/MazF family toxin [Deltaproteobacteria bacterium]|nr:type II toxin-antitoxin system PemK/MazF family toxin [Deltaproteobacteria bacterium]